MCSKEECEKYYTNSDKWRVSILSGFLFLLISAPFLYRLNDRLLSNLLGNRLAYNGCPTTLGLLLHTAVFVLVTRLLMR